MKVATARRIRAITRNISVTVLLAATFLSAFIAGIALHLPLPPSRRLATWIVAVQVSREMSGSIEVDRIEQLDVKGFVARNVVVRAPGGEVVLASPRLRARANLLDIAASVVFGSGPIEVRFSWVHADNIDMYWTPAPDGELLLVKAFRPPPAPTPAVPPSKPSRPLIFDLPAIEIGTVAVRGRIGGIPKVDFDARTVRGTFRAGPGGIEVDSSRFPVVVRQILPGHLTGNVELHFRTPSRFWTSFVASYEELLVSGSIHVNGGYMDVVLDLPRTPGPAVAVLIPQVPVDEPVAAKIEAHGDLPNLNATANLTVGDAHSTARGLVSFSPRFGVDLNTEVRDLDVRTVIKDAPEMVLDADVRVTTELADKGARVVRVRGRTQPTEIEGNVVPPTSVDAVVSSQGVKGNLLFHEPGMPVDADFQFEEQVLQWTARTKIPSVRKAPRLEGVFDGQATATMQGRYAKGEVEATITADIRNASRAGVRLGDAHVTARAWGSPSDLSVDAGLQGSQLHAGGLRWQRVTAAMQGSLDKPRVTVSLRDETGPDLKADASLSLRGGVAAHGLSVQMDNGGESIKARAQTVDTRAGFVDFGAIAIDGLGAPVDGEVRVGARSFNVRLASDGVDLKKLSRVLGLPPRMLSGEAEVDINLKNKESSTDGCIRVDVQNGRFDFVDGVDASIRAEFLSSHVDLDANVSVGGEGDPPPASSGGGACLPARTVRGRAVLETSMGANITLAGPPSNLESWKDAVGTARLNTLLVNLDRLGQILGVARTLAPELALPDVGGTVKAHGDVVRDRPDDAPSWSLALSSQGLSVAMGADEERRTVRGADLFGFAAMSKKGGLTSSFCVRDDLGAYDEMGACDPKDPNVLAILTAITSIDYPALLRTPKNWRAILEPAEVKGKLVVVDHNLRTLLRPIPWVRPLPVHAASVGGEVSFQGTLKSPSFAYTIRASDLGPRNPDWRFPNMVCARGAYDGKRASLQADVLRRIGDIPLESSICARTSWQAGGESKSRLEHVGQVTADLLVHWDDIFRVASFEELSWAANANVVAKDFELGDVPVLADNDISGKMDLSGGVVNLGRSPQFGLQARVTDLRAGSNVSYDKSEILVRTDKEGMSGHLALYAADKESPQRVAPRLVGDFVTKRVRWAGGTVPSFDSEEPVHFRMDADGFNIAVLGTIFEPVLSYVDGSVSGLVRGTWSPNPQYSRFHSVHLVVKDGAFQVPMVGQEFLNVSATLRSTKKPNQLVVEDFKARSLTGALAANARIDLDGLRIAHVAASVATDERNKLRLTFEGVPVGDLHGNLFVNIHRTEELNDTVVELDQVRVDLSDADLRTVQDLAANSDVVVVPTADAGRPRRGRRGGLPGRDGSRRGNRPSDRSTLGKVDASGRGAGGPRGRGADPSNENEGETETESAPIPWRVTLRTRNPVFVKRAGMDLSVVTPKDLKDVPVLIYPGPGTDEPVMHGYVTLFDGRMNVVGKYFDLERGRIIFSGDPSDPALNVIARWDAPDGTRVYAIVTGPLKDPKVNFRSEPARPPGEILAMVLFGTSQTEGADSSQSGDRTAAAGMGGGVATAGLNRLLEDVSPVNISTRVDTSEAENVRPTVVVEVARNVTAEAAVNTNKNELKEGDRYLLTVDWRFLRKWSLRTTVGDRGSSIVDVLWQHHY